MKPSTDQPVKISLPDARRGMLACQGLYPPRSWKGKRGVKSFFKSVRSIQFDPINVVGRNPDLVLQSRVVDYNPSLLDGLLYEDRYLVDNWDKKASLSLAEDWPYFSRYRARMEEYFGVPSEAVMSLAPTVIDQIRKEGPQCSLDYKIEQKTDWAWGPTRITRASLEGLYKMGKLGVHHRVNNRRYFDLIENLLPAELLNAPDPCQNLEVYQRWHVVRRIGAMGLAHPNAGEQWGGMIGVKSPRRREILQELIADGEIVVIEVEGLEGDDFYMRSEDVKLLQQSRKDQAEKRAAFIAPLDNLLWDRKTIKRLFDLNYMWEVYKPKKQREYGYYVLPVLYGEEFVGRFDPSFDKKTGRLTINNWWWEEGVEFTQPLAEALKGCLSDFLVYLNAKDLVYSKNLLEKGGLEWLREIQ
jgi:uncharacterized protein YcaQ